MNHQFVPVIRFEREQDAMHQLSGGVLAALAYYLGARIGFALQSPVVPQSILWLPNSILLSALLLVPVKRWPLYLLTCFVAQIAVGVHVHAPMLPITTIYITNGMDAALGAYVVLRLTRRHPNLNRLRHTIILLLTVTATTVLLSFADAGVSVVTGWTHNYWAAWETRARANALTNVVVVPMVLGFYETFRRGWHSIRWPDVLQAALLVALTIVVADATFGHSAVQRSPALLYLPLPVLIIGAVRFGMGLTALQTLILALVAGVSLVRGFPVFTPHTGNEDVTAVQIFLFATSVPLLCLASVVGERRATATLLLASERRVRRQYAQLSTIYRSSPIGLAYVDKTLRVLNANSEIIAISGGTARSLTVGTMYECLPALAYELQPIVTQVLMTGHAALDREIRVTHVGAPNEPLDCLVTCDPVRDAAGDVIGVNIVVQDLTDRNRAEKALEASRKELQESYGRRLDLAGRMIAAQETERMRLAQELHDDFSQRFAEMSLSFGSLRQQLGETRGGVKDELSKLRQLSSELANAMRNLSHDLYPAVLPQVGLVGALRARAVEFSQQQGIRVDCEAQDIELPDDIGLCLFRITQEGLSNIARHSSATRVHITLTATDSAVELLLKDNGTGFDPNRAFKNVGLFSVEERARLVNGTVTIESAIGKGTILRVVVPLGDDLPPAHKPTSDVQNGIQL